jgi:HSP20 family molecular chaperone IbpA
MRMRFRSITYSVGGTPSSLERHYRELRESMLGPGQHYGLQSALPWRPPIDIHETPDAIQVKIELAGLSEDLIEVTLYENALVVTGQREDDIEQGESIYYHEAQVRYGPFRADMLLTVPVDREAVQATYESGFLRIRLPKAATLRGEPVAPGEYDRERQRADERSTMDATAPSRAGNGDVGAGGARTADATAPVPPIR